MRSFASLLLTTLLTLVSFADALTGGSYVITNAAFPLCRVVGTNSQTEGVPVTTFCFNPGDSVTNDSIWTVNSALTTLQVEFLSLFALTDATGDAINGSNGAGIFSWTGTNPQSPFIVAGPQTWEFIQGSSGMFIALAGTDLVWSMDSNTLFTQIRLAPLNSANLQQQWIFTAHGLV